MVAGKFRPGYVSEARPITHEFLEQQWKLELRYKASGLDMKQLSFTDADWQEWEWKANLGLHENRRWGKAPAQLRNLLIPQMTINKHLIESFGKLIGGWQQWDDLSRLKRIHWQPESHDFSSFILPATAHLEQARDKLESLTTRRKVFQIVSLRQHRLFQHLAALLRDLEPMVQSIADYTASSPGAKEAVLSVRDDILWHSREAFRLAGSLKSSPVLLERLHIPRTEINRMLSIACLSHCTLLKAIFKFTQQ